MGNCVHHCYFFILFSAMRIKGIKSKPFMAMLSVFIFTSLLSPVYSQKTLGDTVVTERLHTLEQMLAHGKSNANTWWYGWLIGYSAATVVQGAIMLTSDSRDTRQDMALGGVTTILGVAGQLITPNDPGSAPGKLDEMPENTAEEKIRKLEKAELLLKQCAERERSGRSWQQHALVGVVDLASGFTTWFGFHRNALAGIENFGLNTLVAEVQIFTQPTQAMKDYKAYLNKYSGLQSSGSKNCEIRMFVFAVPGGMGVRLIF